MEPRLATRYRSTIEDELRCALAGDTPLHEVLRVHVGLEDESGAPTAALGKLIRPSLLLFTAEELDGDPNAARSAAVSLELVHEFLLIHDDVQNGDRTRRGRPTVCSRWGEAQAINAGDLMLVLALVEAGRAGDKVLHRLLDTVIEMVEGQAFDASFEGRWPSMGEYTAMTDKRTGELFRCAFELGAILSGAPRETQQHLSEIGRELGRAYRIRGDLLEIWGRKTKLGEPIGTDLRRRRRTYPVVAALAKASDGERRTLEIALGVERISDEAIKRVLKTMERLRVREDGVHRVDEHLEHVLSEWGRLPLPETGKDEMRELCESLRLTEALESPR